MARGAVQPADVLAQAGFATLELCGRLALEGLLSTAQRCGVYVLHLADGACYVGQARDVAARFPALRRTCGPVERISLRALAPDVQALDQAEHEALALLARAGVRLLNSIHPLLSARGCDFDLLVGPQEQRRWLEANPLAPLAGDDTRPQVTLDGHARTAARFQALARRPDRDLVLDVLRRYTRGCLPWPRRSEQTYWGVSCMPPAPPAWPRLACFQAGTAEVCALGHAADAPDRLWLWMNLARAPLLQVYPSSARLRRQHPRVRLEPLRFAPGGMALLQAAVRDHAAALQLLADPAVLRAARLLNLQLMRLRANQYAFQHCFLLADQLLGAA